MNVRRSQQCKSHSRQGSITPAVIVALIVVMLAFALVLDQLWLDTAVTELTGGAEAAALAAARSLASDDLLRKDVDTKQRLKKARQAASDIAAKNLVAGDSVQLNANPKQDIRFGRLARNVETGLFQFLETDINPASVVVLAERTRGRGNPIGLFIRGLSGQAAGDAAATAEATIDNRIVRLRPLEGINIPAMPIAALFTAPKRTDTWLDQIEWHNGPDLYSYNETTNQVEYKPDGICELVLRTNSYRSRKTDDRPFSNVQVLEFGSRLADKTVIRQINEGLTAEDLEMYDGELLFDGFSRPISSQDVLSLDISSALANLIGECRLCFISSSFQETRNGFGNAGCLDIIAVRIMSVRIDGDDSSEIVIQPCVMTTRTAVLVNDEKLLKEAALSNDGTLINRDVKNPYVYKLTLTN